MPVTYSFADVTCAIDGPGGRFSLSEANVADEGITIEMVEDKSTMTTGATRGGMHSLHESRAGRVTIRLLKNSPVNRLLTDLYRSQSASSALWGQNTISLSNSVWQDDHTCAQCAFVRMPTNANAKDGGMMEWQFNSLDVDSVLGDGIAAL
ncbi:phage protein [Methylobacterium komagatae]